MSNNSIAFTADGTVVTTAWLKDADTVNYQMVQNVKLNGALGDGSTDDSTAINALLATMTTGGTLYFPPTSGGKYKINSQLNVSSNGIRVLLDDSVTIDYSAVVSNQCFAIAGNYCSLEGGLNGGLLGPTSWDGTNAGAPTYGVVWITGNNFTAKNIRLQNVKKVGFGFKDVLDGAVLNCVIEGNYPTGSWTGVETVHFGVFFDPSASTDPAGNYRALGNSIKTCVQGVFVGNYGAGQFSQGVVITGNLFNDCWNHGIYTNYTSGAIISGNVFNRCQQLVACSGPYNAVVGNTSYTSVTSAGDQRDLIGISFRDAQGCICSNNVIKGVNDSTTPTVINFQNFDGTTPSAQNIIENNVIESDAGTSFTNAIRIISAATPVSGNIIRGNSIKAFGTTAVGMIFVQGSSGVPNEGNIISNNVISQLGDAYGIQCYYLDGTLVSGNIVNYVYNAGSAKSPVTVHFFNTTKSTCSNNTSVCPSSFGTNLGITGFFEDTGCLNNNVNNNNNAVDLTHATFNVYQSLASSKLNVNESGLGAPNQTALTGSMWRRTDGGASTTLYIKETAFSSSVWRGV